MATTVTKTIRSSGGDYTSISAWVTGEMGDLVTADEVRVAECYNDWPTGLDDLVDLNSADWTTDSTRYPKITVAAGERHDGTPQTGFHMVTDNRNSNTIGTSVPYSLIEYIDVEQTTGFSAGADCYHGSATGVVFDKCIGACNHASHQSFNGNGGPAFRNCLAWKGGDGFQINAKFTVLYAQNCTAAGLDSGFIGTDGGEGFRVQNCVAYNCATSWVDFFHGDSTNNAASDASTNTPPGTNPITTDIVAGDFVDAANDDYHLASGSTLIDAGADLSADLTTDIDGETRSTPFDVGADEFVSSANNLTFTAQAQNATTSFSVGVENDLTAAAQAQAAVTSFSLEAISNDLTLAAQAQSAQISVSMGVLAQATLAAQAQDAQASFSAQALIDLSLSAQAQAAQTSFSLTENPTIDLVAQAQSASASFSLAKARDVALAAEAQPATASFSMLRERSVIFAAQAQASTSSFSLFRYNNICWDEKTGAGASISQKTASGVGVSEKSEGGKSVDEHRQEQAPDWQKCH